MNRDIDILKHIIIHAERIIFKTKGKTKTYFISNQDEKDIVCFNYLQMGELAKQLSDEYCSKHDEKLWKELKRFRDKIAHGYGEIDFNFVYDYSTNDVIKTLEICKKSIEELK